MYVSVYSVLFLSLDHVQLSHMLARTTCHHASSIAVSTSQGGKAELIIFGRSCSYHWQTQESLCTQKLHKVKVSSICMQVGRDSNGNVVIGNATIIATNVAAANGVVHVIDRFPLDNAAFNTTMVAALEAAGDFGPFDEAKVTSPASFLVMQQLGWGLGPL